MHIAVDGGTWANRRGYGRFTREILAAASAKSDRHAFSLVVDQSVARADLPSALRIVQVDLGTAPSVAAAATSRRSLRDLWRMKGQMLAICMVIVSGVCTYVMLIGTMQSLTLTRDRFYQDFGFAEVFASLKYQHGLRPP